MSILQSCLRYVVKRRINRAENGSHKSFMRLKIPATKFFHKSSDVLLHSLFSAHVDIQTASKLLQM